MHNKDSPLPYIHSNQQCVLMSYVSKICSPPSEQDQTDLLNLPSYRVINAMQLCAHWKGQCLTELQASTGRNPAVEVIQKFGCLYVHRSKIGWLIHHEVWGLKLCLGLDLNDPRSSFIYLFTKIAMILLTGWTFFPLSLGVRLIFYLGPISADIKQ